MSAKASAAGGRPVNVPRQPCPAASRCCNPRSPHLSSAIPAGCDLYPCALLAASPLLHSRVRTQERWALLPRNRADKAVSFLTDPTWRAYSHCYTEGLRLCRAYVDGDPTRFERLVTDQLLPADLAAAAA